MARQGLTESAAPDASPRDGVGDALVRACVLAVIAVPAFVIALELAWRWWAYMLAVITVAFGVVLLRARRAR